MRDVRDMESEAARIAALSPAERQAHDAALLAHRRELGLESPAVEPAPMPGGIDFSNWSYNTVPERTGNPGWRPDLQELIYTAINHVEGDYEDADENCGEQVIERLVLAIKGLLVERDAGKLSAGAADVITERRRQVTDEGFDTTHDDDEHFGGWLGRAAAAYALYACASEKLRLKLFADGPPDFFPWARRWWKPKVPRRDLVRAGALIIAEIDRYDRDAARGGAK